MVWTTSGGTCPLSDTVLNQHTIGDHWKSHEMAWKIEEAHPCSSDVSIQSTIPGKGSSIYFSLKLVF